ncbi:MAG: TROVE domain-containing protein [Myxococcales bacterium]|nr:TROVE domain-containing protein [Myxococcales bacterium]MCB9702802.1 TROVE domain-containing protein [Myxococcales bacterium]
MANKNLFRSTARVPATDTRNEAGGVAYSLEAKHALAQYAATGCLNSTYYAGAAEQLEKVLDLCAKIDPTFIAKTAVYARERGLMKDMPALLVAHLAARDGELCERVFGRVIDNGKLLRNFVQIVRSGATGRRSLGTRPKRLVQRWIDKRSDDAVFAASVGNDPSLADIIKMVHPKPATAERRALLGYLLGRPYDVAALPAIVRSYEDYKAGRSKEVPNVHFQMLTSLPLDAAAWRSIAQNAGWQMTRMNLNTFARHGVFEDRALTRTIAARLRHPKAIQKARVFPYQLMVAYTQVDAAVPAEVKEALQEAMEVALANVPEIAGQVYVLPDVSGSMHSPATGHRKGSTSVVRCIDVAALIGAAFLRQNPRAEVIPFSDHVVKASLNRRDSVMTNAQRLASLPSGGTKCSAPLAELNRRKATGDLVIFVSDNESWIDGNRMRWQGTAVMDEWEKYKARNRRAKLVCIDIQPYATTQAPERADILNIGGFSDAVFDLIAAFAQDQLHPEHWVGIIDGITL